MLGAPRTDPDVRLSRIRFLPRVSDGEALVRPWMEAFYWSEPVVGDLQDPGPCHRILLTASPERSPP